MPLPSPDDAGVEGLGSGVTDGLPGADADLPLFDADPDPPEAGARVAQLADGLGLALPFAVPDALALGWPLGLADAFAEALTVGLALTLGLALMFGLALALPLPVALPVGLGLALALPAWLAVPLSEDETGGVCGGAVGLGLVDGLADGLGLAVLGFAELDGLSVGDEHGEAAGLVGPGDALPSTPLVPEAIPEPRVPAELDVLLGDPESPAGRKAWRSGGTRARTTATANTATPMASAGRSIASRQPIGRRRGGRACPGPVPRPGAVPRRPGAAPRGALCSPCVPDKRRTRPATKPDPARRAPVSGSLAEA